MNQTPIATRVSFGRIFDLLPASRERVRVRTCELALLAGRAPPQVSQTDYEQAKREVTGESDPARQDAVLDALRHG